MTGYNKVYDERSELFCFASQIQIELSVTDGISLVSTCALNYNCGRRKIKKCKWIVKKP